MAEQGMTYAASGVRYDDIDPFKKYCQELAAATATNAEKSGVVSQEVSRGESCYVFKTGEGATCGDNDRQQFFGAVIEGLGTRNLIADAMKKLTGKCYYRSMGRSTAATA